MRPLASARRWTDGQLMRKAASAAAACSAVTPRTEKSGPGVTPLFAANDLVARGVQMEAKSAEDNGEAIQFNVFVYNVEPGVAIDYVTGEFTESNS